MNLTGHSYSTYLIKSCRNWNTLPILSSRGNSSVLAGTPLNMREEDGPNQARLTGSSYKNLRNKQVEATQAINAFYKGADRLRTTARATTEIFSDFQQILNDGGSQDDMEVVLQKIQRLAIYSFATGKELDQEAKDLAIKTIQLPENMQYLRDGEDESKDMAFPPEVVEQIQQSRYCCASVKGRSVMLCK
ncbi:hypothetical protein BD408DRAFT_486444 [Parasitella parasitica]|nr:hypothetical protein BD408DRAFT_486444 [Parasitella parasitica]